MPSRPAPSAVPVLTAAQDVTAAMLRHAEDIADAYFPNSDESVDWEQFIDRFADPHGHSGTAFEIEEYDNPAVRKIQRHVRKYRAEG